MDRVKAVKVLKPLVAMYVDYANISMKEEDDNIVEALEMAIEALDAPDTNVGDLISRQAAIDAMGKAKWAKERLMELPPARPEPKEGRWINGKCDLCGEHAPFWCMASTYHESNFCPNCGADMRGDQK